MYSSSTLSLYPTIMFVVFLFMGSFFGFRGTNKQFLLTVPPPLWDFFDRAEIGIFEKKMLCRIFGS